jgi:hypothetical protein
LRGSPHDRPPLPRRPARLVGLRGPGALERAAVAAARAGDGLLDRVAGAAAAGHALDYDDAWTPGLAHLSAPTAPAAQVVAADAGLTVGTALRGYAAGFEAMGAVVRASHPALYDAGRHPTVRVRGTVGAAVATAHVRGFGEEATEATATLGLLARLDKLAESADNSSAAVGACRGTAVVGSGLIDSLRAAGLLLEPRGMRFIWDARSAAVALLDIASEHGLEGAVCGCAHGGPELRPALTIGAGCR